MTESWDWRTNVSMSGRSKSESENVNGLSWSLSTNNGALFSGPDNSGTLWAFGGTTSDFNTSFPFYEKPPITRYGIWSYHLATELWSAIDASSEITVPSYGASAEAPTLGLAFYLGGQLDSGTADETSSLDSATVPLPGIVVLDTTSRTIVNLSMPGNAKGSRVGGGMVYVDTFGKKRILIVIGGSTSTDGFLTMDQIAVFDVNTLNFTDTTTSTTEKNAWFVQRATGDIPEPRSDFCLVQVSAQDDSSSNIYLYGGCTDETVYDDIYVLSLPSFTWVRVYLGADHRWSMTCHFMPPCQMITVGGLGVSTTDVTADCDWETKSLAVLDMSTIGWGSVFNADASAYEVPNDVVAQIGDTAIGGATKRQPGVGWSISRLAQIFAIQSSDQNSTSTTMTTTTGTSIPTSSSSSSSSSLPPSSSSPGPGSSILSTGAIVGIAIAGPLKIVVAATTHFLVRKKQKKKQPPRSDGRRIAPYPHLAEKFGHPLRPGQWERVELAQ